MLGPVSAVQVSCSTLFSKTLNHIYTDSHYIFYMYEEVNGNIGASVFQEWYDWNICLFDHLNAEL